MSKNLRIAISETYPSGNVYVFDTLKACSYFLNRASSYCTTKINNAINSCNLIKDVVLKDKAGIEYRIVAYKNKSKVVNEGYKFDSRENFIYGKRIILVQESNHKKYEFKTNKGCASFLRLPLETLESYLRVSQRIKGKDGNYYRVRQFLEPKINNNSKNYQTSNDILYRPLNKNVKTDLDKMKKRIQIKNILAVIDMEYGSISEACKKNAPEFHTLRELMGTE